MRRALSLVELLVVVAIIAVLAALVLAGAGMVRRAAAVADTSRRLLEVQTALQSYGAGAGGGLEGLLLALRANLRAGALALPAAAFPGVVRWRVDTRIGRVEPEAGEAWPATRPPWMLDHPWGRVPTDLPGTPTRLPAPAEEPLPIEPFGLSALTAAFSAELLMLAGALPVEGSGPAALDAARTRYRSDRGRRAAWNDAWGGPLTVGFAWYHPRLNPGTGGIVNQHARFGSLHSNVQQMLATQRSRPDHFIQRANEAYGFARAVYIAPAALGGSPPPGLADTQLSDPAADWTGAGGVLERVWQAVDAACNREGASELWRSGPGIDLAGRPPWTGVRQGRTDGAVRLLAAPLEVR